MVARRPHERERRRRLAREHGVGRRDAARREPRRRGPSPRSSRPRPARTARAARGRRAPLPRAGRRRTCAMYSRPCTARARRRPRPPRQRRAARDEAHAVSRSAPPPPLRPLRVVDRRRARQQHRRVVRERARRGAAVDGVVAGCGNSAVPTPPPAARGSAVGATAGSNSEAVDSTAGTPRGASGAFLRRHGRGCAGQRS